MAIRLDIMGGFVSFIVYISPFVVKLRLPRKLSDTAWTRLTRSISRAIKATQAKMKILISIFLTNACEIVSRVLRNRACGRI